MRPVKGHATRGYDKEPTVDVQPRVVFSHQACAAHKGSQIPWSDSMHIHLIRKSNAAYNTVICYNSVESAVGQEKENKTLELFVIYLLQI